MFEKDLGLVPLANWCLHKSKEKQVGTFKKYMELVLYMVLLVGSSCVYKRRELVFPLVGARKQSKGVAASCEW